MSRLWIAVAICCAAAGPAAAQKRSDQPALVSIKRMSLDTALRAARAAIEACRKEGVQVAVTVIDRGDVLRPADLAARRSLHQSVWSAGGLVMSAGGLPIQAGGELVGAIGVSGAPSGKTDELCARKGIEAIVEDLELGG